MKRYFFLGLGIGFILSGTLFTLINKNSIKKIKNNIIFETKNEQIVKKNNEFYSFDLTDIIDESDKNSDNIAIDNFKDNIQLEEKNTHIKLDILEEEFKDVSKVNEAIENSNNKTYHIQLLASKNIHNCNNLLNHIEKNNNEKLDLKVIGTGGIYRLITVSDYEYLEALKLADKLKQKYEINTYVKEN
ncbi:MAG: SPOR domain-containing protein [Fusobacteria bacterium]|nr:SPOR domain-containing protein [Fusobacteriota bacterium]